MWMQKVQLKQNYLVRDDFITSGYYIYGEIFTLLNIFIQVFTFQG